MAKNETFGRLTTWPDSLITVVGHLAPILPRELLKYKHMTNCGDHCGWPPAPPAQIQRF